MFTHTLIRKNSGSPSLLSAQNSAATSGENKPIEGRARVASQNPLNRVINLNDQFQTGVWKLPQKLKDFVSARWETAYSTTRHRIENNSSSADPEQEVAHLQALLDKTLTEFSSYLNKKRSIDSRLQFLENIATIFPISIYPPPSRHKASTLETEKKAAFGQNHPASLREEKETISTENAAPTTDKNTSFPVVPHTTTAPSPTSVIKKESPTQPLLLDRFTYEEKLAIDKATQEKTQLRIKEKAAIENAQKLLKNQYKFLRLFYSKNSEKLQSIRGKSAYLKIEANQIYDLCRAIEQAVLEEARFKKRDTAFCHLNEQLAKIELQLCNTEQVITDQKNKGAVLNKLHKNLKINYLQSLKHQFAKTNQRLQQAKEDRTYAFYRWQASEEKASKFTEQLEFQRTAQEKLDQLDQNAQKIITSFFKKLPKDLSKTLRTDLLEVWRKDYHKTRLFLFQETNSPEGKEIFTQFLDKIGAFFEKIREINASGQDNTIHANKSRVIMLLNNGVYETFEPLLTDRFTYQEKQAIDKETQVRMQPRIKEKRAIENAQKFLRNQYKFLRLFYSQNSEKLQAIREKSAYLKMQANQIDHLCHTIEQAVLKKAQFKKCENAFRRIEEKRARIMEKWHNTKQTILPEGKRYYIPREDLNKQLINKKISSLHELKNQWAQTNEPYQRAQENKLSALQRWQASENEISKLTHSLEFQRTRQQQD